jgi:Ca2+-binding EF-hand superfamily protein
VALPRARHAILTDIAAEEEVLRQAFQFFDKDGNGEVSCVELRTTMTELGGLLSEQEIGAFAAIMDANNDGVISVGGAGRRQSACLLMGCG